MEKQKILIVDDDAHLRRALEIRLQSNHYDTVQAGDAYSAIAVANKERPDLIILDLGLPAGDGFLVLERLQRKSELACIPVVVLTARDPQPNQERARQAGVTAFFQKPANNQELLDAIRAALPIARQGTAWPS
jgi:DNA-binding response OmpR family regulator